MTGYDYIIVGAGSAGCVLANRLTASGAHRVLLLEAGGSDRSPWIQVPIGYGRTFNDPRYNWMYEAQPDPALDNRRAFWPRGKVLGGSSSINAMVYVRGQPADFDDWCAAGNPGWSWAELLPYFRKLEDHPWGASEFHGIGGPVHVSDVSASVHPLCGNFLEACGTLDIPYTRDFNGAQPEGAGLWQVTIRDGVRVSFGQRLPAPGAAAREPHRAAARAGDAAVVQRHARQRRRIPAARHAAGGARAARGAACRRRRSTRRSCSSCRASARRRCCAASTSR